MTCTQKEAHIVGQLIQLFNFWLKNSALREETCLCVKTLCNSTDHMLSRLILKLQLIWNVVVVTGVGGDDGLGWGGGGG